MNDDLQSCIALTANPLFASGVLTIMLAFYFLVDGIFELIAGFQMKPVSGWGFMVTAGSAVRKLTRD